MLHSQKTPSLALTWCMKILIPYSQSFLPLELESLRFRYGYIVQEFGKKKYSNHQHKLAFPVTAFNANNSLKLLHVHILLFDF